MEACRPQVTRVCYRMLGSMVDAEDAVQETMLRAWRASGTFAGRSSLSTWLCRIGTRVCLDMRARRSRTLPPLLQPAGSIVDELEFREPDWWVEPAADAWLSPDVDGPQQASLLARESVQLAWVTALQQLPPKQRACLVLMEVVELSADETAETLEMSVAAVNSAAQRARRSLRDVRARMATEDPSVTANHEAVQAFAEAFGRYDLEALSRLLRDDTTMCMPPLALWLRGAKDIVAWMEGRGAGCRGSRIVPTRANGAPAWAQYRPAPGGGFTPWALVMPVARDGVVAELHFFLDTAALYPRFGLPMSLPEEM